MKSWYWGATLGFLALSLTSCNNKPKTPGEIGNLAGESVVLVSYEDKPGQGTGFFISGEDKSACTVLTARHVIPPNAKLQLQTSDQYLWKNTQIKSLKRFPKQDLALVTFKPEGRNCPYKALSLGNSDKVAIGDNIYITGFPGNGLGRQFVEGKVSLIGSRTEGYGISYTAITAGGMSGSPVLNTNGEVIAVHGRTEVELAQLAAIKGEQPKPQQQSTTGLNSQIGDAVGTFRWGVPINTYITNVAQISTEETLADNSSNTGTKWTPKTAEQWLALGRDSLASKRYEEALATFDKAIDLQPDSYIAWDSRGIALYYLKRYKDSFVSHDKAVELKPDHALGWSNRGIPLNRLKRYTEALASFDKAIDLKYNFDPTWSSRGNALYWLKRYTEALAAYEKAIAIKPSSANWQSKGAALQQLNRYKDAIASYEKAIQINSDWGDSSPANAFQGQASSLYSLGRYEEALTAYDQAITLKPDNYQFRLDKGLVLNKLNRYSDAIALFDEAIAIKPDYAVAWSNRCLSLYHLQRYEEMITSCDKAVAIKPDDALAWSSRGLALSEFQRYEKAISSYEKAIAIKPDNAYTWNNRGWSLQQMKRYEEALKSYEKAILISPDYQTAINNRKNLLKKLGRSN
ncbi:tetratricopeptide repeat protein [Trichormus sp. NMC-1]|uniref:tetratricopeptide repeat protein n=1 Tax=Trichormus sp. NMC-1 TaxID=1853259 RepID=UPI0008DC0E8D|nr:tetratricopeptide repeat protein [Trichormus sp. NMC-1]